MGPTRTPHDRLFHFTFRNPRHVAAWLRCILPADVVAALDWATLTPAGERSTDARLRTHTADLVFTVRLHGSDEQVLLVIEHKAWPDAGLLAQSLRYVVHVRRLAMRNGKRLPLVVAAVLQHGGEIPEQDAARSDLPEPIRATFLPLQPQLRLVIDSLHGRSEAELRRPTLSPLAQLTHLALAKLPQSASDEVVAAIDRWGDLLRAIEHTEDPTTAEESLSAIGCYVLEVTDVPLEELQMAFTRNLEHTSNPIMTTAQRLRSEGISQGLSQGITKGITQGISVGITQGISQGISQGSAATLLRLLARRFGPLPDHVATRLHAATPAELERWTDRLLDAPDLVALFDD